MEGRQRGNCPKWNGAIFGRVLLSLLWLGLLAGPLAAAELTPLLSLQEVEAVAGQPFSFSVYFHNEGKSSRQVRPPASLRVRLEDEAGQVSFLNAREQRPSTPVYLERGGFIKTDYLLVLPETSVGRLQLSIVDSPNLVAQILVTAPAPQLEAVGTAPPAQQVAEVYPTLASLHSLYQPYVANFSVYEPVFFLVASKPEKSRFQISFKYRLFNPRGSFSQRYPWLQGVHFGYTQSSTWDLRSASAPFEDTSYKPEIFFLTDNLRWRPSWLKGFFVQFGAQHESNGRGGVDSRSTNSVYLKPIFISFNPENKLGLQLSPKLLTYFNNDEQSNPDLADYRGHFELELKLGHAESLVASSKLRFASRGVSFQGDLTYPISRLLGGNFDFYLQLQYVDALAESLINYRERTRVFRLGIALVR